MFIIFHDQKANSKVNNPKGFYSNGTCQKSRDALPPDSLFNVAGGSLGETL